MVRVKNKRVNSPVSKLPFRFDYEEKLLEKVIRTDIQMQQVLEKLETVMGTIGGICCRGFSFSGF